MKNFTAVFVLMVLSAASAFGQNAAQKSAVCTDEVIQRISSRGIKIGADINDVLALFALTEEEKQKIRSSASRQGKANFGYEFFGVSPNRNLNQVNERFAGISDYIFDFLDERLNGFSVSYDKPKWRDAEQFAGKMAEIFDLPDLGNWRKQSNEVIDIQCGNYRLSAQTDSQTARSTFGIYDTRLVQILEQRKRKGEDEQREKDLKTFKP